MSTSSVDRDMVRQAVRELLDKEAPLEQVDAWDEAAEYPADFYRRLADLGYYGATFNRSEDEEGSGVFEAMILAEELGRRGLDLAGGYSLTEFLGMNVARHGSAEQRARYLEPASSGELRFSIAMTEPEAGSDAAGIRLSGKPVVNGFVLNGQKTFITGGGLPATVLHVTAITDPDAGRHKGMTIFLVPNDTPGVETNRLKTLGRHILGTYEIFFNDVFVTEDQILGGLNQGWSVLGSGLGLERLFGCASYVGMHRQILDLLRSYVSERKQFGRPIGRFQAVAHPIADIFCDYEASRALTYAAADLVSEGKDAVQAVSVAKLFGSEAVQRASNVGMQLMGGYGYMYEYSMQRLWREARIATVLAGTSEIQRTIISRNLGIGGR